ncbi:response regulator transcription factor [Curtobacterium sp. VKM Ac-2865]|jgi:DNA-binding NarL/FixJ family response regulator|uniref:response regulator n=1 Tax=Curtobacterium sp. VKM Ac-2865 TaxID=2783817 RepID=UPI00188CE107|nr:response regulator transcription factor [Curtobacterium sp. VKM Ac-2865]MBF4583841.1 response regulator transcription factor [Curtobacterium sp. VKM Ac-2865]
MVRVLLVDDHALVRNGLRAVLDTTDDCEVVGEAATGEDAVELAAVLLPDVVVMDLSMPGAGGVAATRALRARVPGARVLVLTTFADDERVRAALVAGATGYLLKDADPDDVVRGVRATARDEAPIDPRVAHGLLPADPARAAAHDTAPAMPPRERDVLVRLARGLSNRQIATELGIAERTVKVHVGSVFRRIGVADRTSAALWARDHGW